MFFSGGGININDIFTGAGNKAGGSGRQGWAGPQRGQDREAEIDITPEQGFSGTEKRISIQGAGGEKTISFKVPAGIMDGEKIKLGGQGLPGVNGGPNGDLYMTVRIKPSSRNELDGINVTSALEVYPWEAALGAEKTVDTMDGRIVVKIPSGIQTDNKIRVSGKGYIDRTGKRGDLYIKIRIINPKVLTPEQRELYEKLMKTS